MNTDTVYVLNQAKLPDNMKVFVDNMPDSISINGTVAVSNITDPIHYDSQLDGLVSIGKDVAEYGIGYSDAISNVAFPMIVAVFAFALPFLFSVINHVNSKYDSRASCIRVDLVRPREELAFSSLCINSSGKLIVIFSRICFTSLSLMYLYYTTFILHCQYIYVKIW